MVNLNRHGVVSLTEYYTLRKALSEKEIIGDRVGRKWRFTKVQLDKYIKRGKSDAEIDSEVENAILNSKRKRK